MSIMSLVLYGTLGLEVFMVLFGFRKIVNALVYLKNTKECYKEYSQDIEMLIKDMKADGLYKKDEEVDVDRLLFSMKLQLADAKFEVWKCVITTLFIIPFLIKTLTFM